MWRSRIFWRLFGAISILLAISLGVLGWLLIGRIETHARQEIRQSLEMKTLLVQELVTRQHPSEWQGQLGRLAKETHSRITLIAADGIVLGDSSERPELMENHRDRPEVYQAEQQGIGMSTRYSETVHQPMMYIARRHDSGPVRYVRLALPLTALAEEIRWLHQVVWTTVGLTLLLALLISMVLARRISSPLVDLAQASRSLAQGEYGKRVLVSSRDEIGTLAGAFNDMSQACATHIAQMEQDRQQLRAIFLSMVEGVLVLDADQNIRFLNEAAGRLLNLSVEFAPGNKLWLLCRHRPMSEAVNHILRSEVPYRCELEWHAPERKVLAVHGSRLPGQPLRGAVLVLHDITHLRQLERIRQDFVANVSHELKTPLAAIQATVETLLDGAIHDTEHNQRFLERVRENSERLHRLVHDLLTLGRIESGQETLEIHPTPVEAAILACISRQVDRANAKQLQLEASAPPRQVAALVDEEALAQILDNLVDNAIKYSPTGGRITLRWCAENGKAIVQVVDTGVGIPEKDLSRVFERFYRVDKARSRELGGTGLGLSIVKHLVQSLGGTIMAASRPGAGSTFTVRLPLANGE